MGAERADPAAGRAHQPGKRRPPPRPREAGHRQARGGPRPPREDVEVRRDVAPVGVGAVADALAHAAVDVPGHVEDAPARVEVRLVADLERLQRAPRQAPTRSPGQRQRVVGIAQRQVDVEGHGAAQPARQPGDGVEGRGRHVLQDAAGSRSPARVPPGLVRRVAADAQRDAAGPGHERRQQGAQTGAAGAAGPGVGADAVPLDREAEEGARHDATGARGVDLDDDAAGRLACPGRPDACRRTPRAAPPRRAERRRADRRAFRNRSAN